MNFMNRSNPVGFFDSGIGGLTVVKEAMSLLPNENIIYFGDTARVPYGSKSNSTIIEYAMQAANFLMKKNIKMLVVACNTVSSVALDELRKAIDIPVIGVIEPGAKMAADETKNGRIGVIGTTVTINSKAYSSEIKKINKKIKVFEKACPLFVPLAEEGWLNHKAAGLIAKEYLEDLKEADIDTLILGCTHYPVLSEVIQKAVGKKVKLINSGMPASFILKNYLEGRGIRSQSVQIGHQDFYVSDLPVKLKNAAERFLGRKVDELHKVDLEELKK